MKPASDERFYRYLSERIDRKSPTALPEQLAAIIRNLIDAETIKEGEKLPSTRTLSLKLGISRSTVCQCYSRLVSEGYFRHSAGGAVFASMEIQNRLLMGKDSESDADFSPELIRDGKDLISRTMPFDLTIPKPLVSSFTEREWRRLSLDRSRRSLGSFFGPAEDFTGSLRLRQAIAGLLRRFRGIKASPENILIASDILHAFLAITVLSGESLRAGIEEQSPHQTSLQKLFKKVFTFPVDEEGMTVEDDAFTRVDTIFLTPNHNFPFASLMSERRRDVLLEKTARFQTTIVEIENDAMLNYGSAKLPPLYKSPTGNVMHVGTLNQILGRGFSLCYVLVPDHFLHRVSNLEELTDFAPSSFTQELLSSFIESSGFESHLRDSTRAYSLWRRIISTTLSRRLGENVSCSGADIGQFMKVVFKKTAAPALNSVEFKTLSEFVVSQLAKVGVRVKTVEENEQQATFLVCFGHLSHSHLEQVVNAVCEVALPIYNKKVAPAVLSVSPAAQYQDFRTWDNSYSASADTATRSL